MAIIWPTQLPQTVLRSGFSEKYGSNAVVSSLDIGTPQTRPRGTFNAVQYTCTITCTSAQKIVFDNFYKNSTLSGTQVFEFPDFYIAGTVINVKFDTEKGVDVKSIGSDWFRISFVLNQQPY